jgi:NAD(P)-dependent dehydrogenase (short-subunit alcohol dehydrogenase family)
VLITAGASGIGAAIAARFVTDGARVAVCDVDPSAVSEFSEAYPGVLAITSDVARESEVERTATAVLNEFGHVDVLVNNAGIAGPTTQIEDLAVAEWQRVLAVNLTGAFLFIRALTPQFKRRRAGCIVNVSTVSTRHHIPNRAAYVASKSGLEGLSGAVARELGPYGVRCNVVAPGFVDNARTRGVVDRVAARRGVSAAQVESEVLQYISLRRKVQMTEIADLCAFLAGPGAAALTGQIISVDGNVEWEP